MTALDEEGLLLDGTNKDLVKNSLVLISNNNSEITSIDSLTSDTVSKSPLVNLLVFLLVSMLMKL